jgi:hypothetical protein
MVAGWDNLLPAWFARLHARHKTPVNSILFVGLVTLAFSLASLIGVKEQEAFQLQDNAATTFYALIYIVLFAIPLVAIKRFGVSAPIWLKVAASRIIGIDCRWFFTLIPITPVDNRLMFAVKIIVVVITALGIALSGSPDRCSGHDCSNLTLQFYLFIHARSLTQQQSSQYITTESLQVQVLAVPEEGRQLKGWVRTKDAFRIDVDQRSAISKGEGYLPSEHARWHGRIDADGGNVVLITGAVINNAGLG